MTATIVYPQGPVTPHGRYHIRKGDLPMVSLQSYNDAIVIWLMGGQAIPDPTRPESVQVKDIRGLIAPWELIEQHGATQDGVTVVDALYGPTEVDVDVELFARDSKHLRRLRRHLLECLDAWLRSEFGWMTHELGYWWAPIRWRQKPDNSEAPPQQATQSLTLMLQADSGFYQSYPDVDEFGFLYEDMTDTFTLNRSAQHDLGPDWPMLYGGNGIGYLYSNGHHALWNDDPDSIFFTGTRRVVCGPYLGYSTASDTQEVSIVFDSTPEFTVGSGAANDLWCRMGRNPDGTWNGTGIRARWGWGYLQLSYFVDFAELGSHTELEIIPPIGGERFTMKAGVGGNPRRFQLLRGTLVMMDVTEPSAGSRLGADYRGVGFGMQGGAAVITQATPGGVREFASGGPVLDAFSTDIAFGLGASWPLRYEGHNDAYVRTIAGEVQWIDNSGTATQEVVCGPYRDFDTETDNQVVAMVLGSFPEWSAPESGANDLWGRMGRNPDGTWNGCGIQLRCTRSEVILTAWVDFAIVWTRRIINFVTPFPGDKWTLVCGYTGNPRLFKVYRNGSTVLEHKESGTASRLGPDYRGIGFGMRAGGALITQATPAIVRKISAGDNAEVTQSGFLERHNAGDQIAYDAYTCYGPGIFGIANGPRSTEVVELGPLAPGEVAHIRTDPRRGGVFDYTPRTGNDTAPVLFGANPTDTMYRKMKGRFTFACAIPPKEPGMRVAAQHVAVSITGGNADSRIMASLTPLRRYPQ